MTTWDSCLGLLPGTPAWDCLVKAICDIRSVLIDNAETPFGVCVLTDFLTDFRKLNSERSPVNTPPLAQHYG
ncbi:MAG: hypothetical protein OHK0035_08600 [Cyanobacteria bacterium J069]